MPAYLPTMYPLNQKGVDKYTDPPTNPKPGSGLAGPVRPGSDNLLVGDQKHDTAKGKRYTTEGADHGQQFQEAEHHGGWDFRQFDGGGWFLVRGELGREPFAVTGNVR